MGPENIQVSNIYDLFIGFAWPFASLLIVLSLREAISKLLQKESISIQVPNGPILQFSSSQAAETISSLFKDFIEVYDSLLDKYQREIYRRVLTRELPPDVSEIIPGFDRNNEMHLGCLRALRGIGLIQPETGEEWNIDSKILVTKFGASLNRYLRNNY